MFPKAVEEMAVKAMRKKKLRELETRVVTHIETPSKPLHEVKDEAKRSVEVTGKCKNNNEQVTITKEDNTESSLAEEKCGANNTSDFASEKEPIRQQETG